MHQEQLSIYGAGEYVQMYCDNIYGGARLREICILSDNNPLRMRFMATIGGRFCVRRIELGSIISISIDDVTDPSTAISVGDHVFRQCTSIWTSTTAPENVNVEMAGRVFDIRDFHDHVIITLKCPRKDEWNDIMFNKLQLILRASIVDEEVQEGEETCVRTDCEEDGCLGITLLTGHDSIEGYITPYIRDPEDVDNGSYHVSSRSSDSELAIKNDHGTTMFSIEGLPEGLVRYWTNTIRAKATVTLLKDSCDENHETKEWSIVLSPQ